MYSPCSYTRWPPRDSYSQSYKAYSYNNQPRIDMIFECKKLRQSSCINKWTIDYPKFENVEQTLWKNIFCSAFHTTRETKLQSFQYRILHRTITYRKKLYDKKLVDSPNFLYCNNIDDIKHFLLSCKILETFGNLFVYGGIRVSNTKIALHYEFLE